MIHWLLFFLLAGFCGATTTCSTGFTGSTCQYKCSDLCRTHTSCTADRCDVPRCPCSGYGSVDQASGQCVCDTGRSGDLCEFAISETICSQSQATGRFSQPSGTSTCPLSPSPATPVCVNASLTYAVSTRGAFEWPNPYPCFPPISDGVFFWPISVADAYIAQGVNNEFSVALFTDFPTTLLEHSYAFVLVPYTWAVNPDDRVYTIHSNYEHSRTLEVDASGPDPLTGRIRVFLSAARLANPTTWYACTVGTCYIRPLRYPGYGLNVNTTTREVFVNSQTVQWTVASQIPQASGSLTDVVLNRTLTPSIVTLTGLNVVDCLSHAMRYYSKRVATFYTSTSTCDLAGSTYNTSTQTGVGATTYFIGSDNADGRLCGSRYYSMPNDADAPDSKCTKRFLGPMRLLYGGVYGNILSSGRASTSMLVADTSSLTVRMRNLTDLPLDSEYFSWNITDETGNGMSEVSISVAYLPAGDTPLCLGVSSSSDVLLLPCDVEDPRTMWFITRHSSGELMRGFNLRPASIAATAGVALEIQPGSSGFNVRIASGHSASVFDASNRWTPWFRGVPTTYAGTIDGFVGLDVTSSIGVYELFTGILMAVGTYDRAHCISLCAARQPDCVAAKIGVAGTCSIWKFDDSQPSTDGRLEHSLFSVASSTVVHYIMNPEPFKSLVQGFFPPRNNSDCLWDAIIGLWQFPLGGYFAMKGGTLGVDSIGVSLFSETKYRNGYYCVNSMDVGPVLLVNIDFDDGESVGALASSNSRRAIVDNIASTSAADIAEVVLVVLHSTGEPFIYTIHNSMAEEMTLEADLSTSSSALTRPVAFSKSSRGSPMKWRINALSVSSGVPLSFEAVDLPGWFLQLDAPLGLPPAGLMIKRGSGRGWDTWLVQFGFQNSGNLGFINQGVKGDDGAILCLTPPDNAGLDTDVLSRCFFHVPSPGACLTICAYQQSCRAMYYDARIRACRVFTQNAFTTNQVTVSGTGIATDFFAFHGNAWYPARCMVDNYMPILTAGFGPDTNSAETWLRTYYSDTKCKRRVSGPFLLFERTDSTPHKVGSRYNVGDQGTPDSTKHFEIIDCTDPAIPFDYTTGCNDGITINSRSLVVLEQVAYDQYYVRMYWKTFHGAETQAYSRYLFIDPSTNTLRVTDFTGYRPTMFNGFRKYVHDGRQYTAGNGVAFAATHGTPIRILSSGEVAVSLTLNNVTHRVTVAASSSTQMQSWSMITPGYQTVRWKYSHTAPTADTIGTIEGIVDAAQCGLLCFANKRCQQASHDAGTAQCILIRRAGSGTIYTSTGNSAHTVYSRPVLYSTNPDDMYAGGIHPDTDSSGFGGVVFMFGNIGTCSTCFSNLFAHEPGLTGESEGGTRPLMFTTAGTYVGTFPSYFWSLQMWTPQTGNDPQSTGIIWIDRSSQAQQALHNGGFTWCFANADRVTTVIGYTTPNWCCNSAVGGFFRYSINAPQPCGSGSTTRFMFVQLPTEYNDGFPRVQAHPSQTASGYYASRSARYSIVVYSAPARQDQFLCVSDGGAGVYFSNDQYDPNCVVYVYYSCTGVATGLQPTSCGVPGI